MSPEGSGPGEGDDAPGDGGGAGELASGGFPEVAQLLPHEPPMLLVDELIAWDGVEAVVSARVRAGQPFAVDGEIPATVCLEYMAQAIGCAAGMSERALGRRVSVGLLLGTRDLRLEVDTLRVGDRLQIRAAKDHADDALARYTCALERLEPEGPALLASGALTVMVAQREESSGHD